MFITGRTMMLSKYSMDGSLKKIKELGFAGVELSMLTIQFTTRPDLLEPFMVEHTVEVAKNLGLPIASVSCHCDYLYDDERFAYLKDSIPVTPSFGTDILIFSNTMKRRGPGEWELIVNRTRELADIAEKYNVKLAMEFEPGMVVGTTAELHKLFDEVGSDKLACNMDIGHSFLCDPEPLQAIESLGQKIVHGHVENMFRGVHAHQPPHRGDMDLKAYLTALRKAGFDGALGLDIYGYDYEEISKDAVPYLNNLIAQL